MAQCTHLLIRNYYIFFVIWKCEIINMFIASFKSFIFYLLNFQMYMKSVQEIQGSETLLTMPCKKMVHVVSSNYTKHLKWRLRVPSLTFPIANTQFNLTIHILHSLQNIPYFFHSFYIFNLHIYNVSVLHLLCQFESTNIVVFIDGFFLCWKII